MADLTTSVLKAISIIADKSIEEVSSNKTIKAIVKKVVSTSEGKYLVNYNSGDFYAYVQPGNTNVYEVGEQVYILVPEGDMGQRKFILDRVDEENEGRFSPKILNSSLLNDYVLLGDNAVIENEYVAEGQISVQRMQPLSLDSSEVSDFYYCYLRDPSVIEGLPQKDNEYVYNTLEYPSVNIDEEVFSNSAKQAEALLLRAKFKASLDMDEIGNYGIIVNIAFADETNPQTDENGKVTYPPKLISYVLDTNKMTGNPMKFYDYTSQYTIAEFDGNNYLYIDSIIAFSEGFSAQISEDADPHIYIDDFEIIALNEVSAINGDYKLKLTAPQGNTVKTGERNDLEILATTTYLNQDVTKNTIFYWGAKDPSITSTSNDYSIKLGSGYRYIDSSNNTNKLILTPGDLTAAENVYVCVGVYESEIVLKATISLYNNNNKLDITIDSDQGTNFQFNEGAPTLTCLINGKTNNYQTNYPDEAFSFIWTKEDNEFGTILLNTTKGRLEQDKQKELDECTKNGVSNAGRTVTQVLSYYSTRIAQLEDVSYPEGLFAPKIKCRLKNTNSRVTYSCSVYRAGIYIGYGTITLQNSKNVINNNYYVTITNGTQVFQYDEAGIAPNSYRRQNPTEIASLIAVFHSPQGVEVTPKKVRWMMPQGKTLINIPSIGLETDASGAKYFVGDVFPLTIKENYDNTCNDNQITVIVTHADGSEYRQTTNLLFTKIGEIGTNGTDTVVKINEPANIPSDECLTIIKSEDEVFYNNGNSEDALILEAELYTNNTQVLGYTTNWSIAGSSKERAYNYKVEGSDNACAVSYDGADNELDTRIVKAEIDLDGKYFYSFYGIPAIEYNQGYSYKDYPVKVMRDGTLKSVLYSSGGTNPTYDESQGAHVELTDWNETGYIDWRVESGPRTKVENDEIYENPNLLLAASPKSKKGTQELVADSAMEDIQAAILKAKDTGEICRDNASASVKNYIQDFLTDIEKIGVDTLLSPLNKLSALWNRLATFNTFDEENTYVKTVYQEYYNLFKQMQDEYDTCKNINKKATEIYSKVQSVWRGEWPSTITEDRLYTRQSSNITTIQELINKYQQAYDNRSNDDAEEAPSRFDIRDSNGNVITPGIFIKPSPFLDLLGNSENYNEGLDKYYGDYSSEQTVQPHTMLVEYGKVLTAYLNLLVEETQDCFNGEYIYKNNKNRDTNLYNTIKQKYKLAYSNWNTQTGSGRQAIGRNIYDSIVSAEGEIAGVYDNIRSLYKYYQSLYLNVKKYQVAEESKTLNAWSAILNGQSPNLLNQIYVIPSENFNGLYMNNNIVGEIFTRTNNVNTVVATVYIPIIMTLNTYELASLNGWDGTSVEVGDNHILTPQVGAGVKDSTTNTFTGMVMGVIGQQSSNENYFSQKKADRVGLIGYSNGRQSVFIDSETGKASFGLPEDDISTEEGTNEGRIELIPGGVSKIGNWKIGNRFLYNIINGSYERRKDEDSRPGVSKNRLMVPHDKHGIILSSDQPYIHIKGQVYKDEDGNENLTGISYEDEYNNINPGDSLELRMDPSDKSLFSIVQHTTGFGDEDIGDLLFGYKSSSSDDKTTVVKSYIANQNNSDEIQPGSGAEYYVYRLATDSSGNYEPYYEEKELSTFSKVNSGSWAASADIYSNTALLSTALTKNNFEKTTTDNPVFSINDSTGIITYNPNNLVWGVNEPESVGFSNGDGWQSITEETSADDFSVVFQYTKNIDTPVEGDVPIGQIKNATEYKIRKMKIANCTIHRELTGLNLNSSANNYIQFYIVSNQNDDIEDALLISDTISIWDNQNKIDIELSSFNGGNLIDGSTNYLKAKVYIDNYTVNANCSCRVKKEIISSYKAPTTPSYGTVKITGLTSSNTNKTFITSGGSTSKIGGTYRIYTINSKRRIQFTVSGYQKNNDDSIIPNTDSTTYDFIVWKQNKILCVGRTIGINQNGDRDGVFFEDVEKRFTGSTSSQYLQKYRDLTETAPSEEDPWYISFYPEGFCTIETITTNKISTPGSSDQNTTGVEVSVITISTDEQGRTEEHIDTVITGGGDTVEGTSTITNNIITSYKKFNDSDIPINDEFVYGIKWEEWDTIEQYNIKEVLWGLKLIDLQFEKILPFIPRDSTKLCVEENTSMTNLQGICYAKTFWEKISNDQFVKKITFFKDYYEWVNAIGKNQIQYSYIDVVRDNGIYYKYIKTLIKTDVDSWFKNDALPLNFFGSEKKDSSGIHHSVTVFDIINNTFLKDALYWKEFIRIGIDENGRFFSSGRQDKKTYSRTGKIYGFGKVPNLYGQEVRVQLRSNNYVPIIKVFSDISSPNTTYITQNQSDSGNISIRTAGNNKYVELAASQFSNNEINTIPSAINCIKVSYNKGVEIYTAGGENKIDLTNKRQLNIETGTISILSKDIDGISKASYNLSDDGYIWAESPSYVVTSASTRGGKSAFTASLADPQNTEGGHYRISASNNDNNPTIQLQVGKNKIGLDIAQTKVILKSDASRFIKIGTGIGEDSSSSFTVDQMKLEFNAANQTIMLKNNGSYIQIASENDATNHYSIALYSNLSGKIDISDGITIKSNKGMFVESTAAFKKNLYAKSRVYANKDLHIGYSDDDKKATKGLIYLYNDEEKRHIKISADMLKQLFDWYNNCRWLIGVNGNTVIMRNVGGKENPEGEPDGSTYHWKSKTFFGYTSSNWEDD